MSAAAKHRKPEHGAVFLQSVAGLGLCVPNIGALRVTYYYFGGSIL